MIVWWLDLQLPVHVQSVPIQARNTRYNFMNIWQEHGMIDKLFLFQSVVQDDLDCF
jgi:hypothetical protein